MKRKKLKNLGLLLGVLFLYYIITQILGCGIPCVFHLVTGFQCPGCGLSRMLIALVKLRFIDAFRMNRCLFCLLPVFAVLIVYWTMKYLTGRKSSVKAVRVETVLYSVLIVILIAWGIVRNIFGW